MKPRIEYGKVASEGRNAMFGLESYVRQCGLEVLLLELVRLRASQINGCAYCVDMHTKDARAEGETEQRLYALVAWEETPFFTERERAALAWTEAVTKVGEGHVADSVFAQARSISARKNWSISPWPLLRSTDGTGWRSVFGRFLEPTVRVNEMLGKQCRCRGIEERNWTGGAWLEAEPPSPPSSRRPRLDLE